MSDPEAVALAVSGNPVGFQFLYDSHRQAVYRQCLRMLRDPDDAEDVTQDIFLQVYQKISSYQFRDCAFSTWLFRVARNKIIDHIRRTKSRPPSGAGDAPETPIQPDQHTRLELEQALDTLPEIERFCVEAKMGGHSMRDLGGTHYLRSGYKHLREVLQ